MRGPWMQMAIVLLVVLVAGGGSIAVATGGGVEKPMVEVPTPEVSDYYVVEPSVPVVYVATGLNFPDALVAGPPAALGDGPLLLVRTDSIPPAVQTELARLNPHKIIISGGNDVVSDGVAAELATYTTTGVVERLEGPTRYETAVEVSKANFPVAPIGIVTDRSEDDMVFSDDCTTYSGLEVWIAPPVEGTVVVHANVAVNTIPHPDWGFEVWLTIKIDEPTSCFPWVGYDTIVSVESGDPAARELVTVPLSHVADLTPGLHRVTVNVQTNSSWGTSEIEWGAIDAVFYPDP